MSRRSLVLVVTRPKFALVGSANPAPPPVTVPVCAPPPPPGAPRFAWLGKLKISARNCSRANPTHAEVLEDGNVPLLLPGVVQQVARSVAEGAVGRRRERGGVEPEIAVAAIRELLICVGLGIANEVVGLTECAIADAGNIVGPEHRERRAACGRTRRLRSASRPRCSSAVSLVPSRTAGRRCSRCRARDAGRSSTGRRNSNRHRC